MADVHGSPADAPQMPAVASPGPAPVPYAGADLSPEPPAYAAVPVPVTDAGGRVMSDASGGILQESPAAHDIAAGTADAPYYAGPLVPVDAAGDDDAGGRDDVASTVAGAVAGAEARFAEHQADTYGQGSTIGDLMTLAPVDSNPAVGDDDPWGPFPPGQPPTGSYI